jgi:hypothetical protein
MALPLAMATMAAMAERVKNCMLGLLSLRPAKLKMRTAWINEKAGPR